MAVDNISAKISNPNIMKTCPVDKTIESRSFDPPIGISGCQKCESLKKKRLNMLFTSTLPGKANFSKQY